MQEEIMRYRIIDDRKARLLARLILKNYLEDEKISTTLASWQKGIHGKPFLLNGPEFNISHSGDYAVVAFSNKPVGVDIEKLANIDVNELLLLFHPDEMEFANSANDRLKAFYNIWSKKEAYLKALGKGITDDVSRESVAKGIVINDGIKWYLKEIELDKGYSCHLCSPSATDKIKIEEIKYFD